MNRDTMQAALWSMRALLRELEERAAQAKADGLEWAYAAMRDADDVREALETVVQVESPSK